MRPASTFWIIQLSNSRVYKKSLEIVKAYFICKYYGILSLTVSRLNNRCISCVFWATAIIIVVSKYSNLFFPFTFFLNGSHAAFGYELIIRSETTDFMESIRDKLSSV